METRPFLYEFLEEVSKKFFVILFTASMKNYAKTLIKIIDPKKKYFKCLLSRDFCCKTKAKVNFYILFKGITTKDLRIFPQIDLKNCLIVDNFVYNFVNQLENGIPILPFYGEKNDNELKKLLHYLQELSENDNMVEINSKNFNFEKLKNVENILRGYERLFKPKQ